MDRANRNRKQVDKLVDVVDDMRAVIDDLTRLVLADLVRRAEQVSTPDGYPPSSRGGSGGGGDGDPVLQVVIQRETERRDVVHDKLAELVASLYEARGHLRRVDKLRRAVVNAGALVKETVTSVTSTCECCGRTISGDGEDRSKQGYGPCCYKPWTRWRKDEVAAGREPSRVRFEHQHQSQHGAADPGMRFVETSDIDALQAARVLPGG